MKRALRPLWAGVLPGLVAAAGPLEAQANFRGAAGTEMVRNLRPSGQPVIPLFEGWYENPDGSHGLCFGYFNLNLEEVLEIPLGPDNAIEPARYDGMQPTQFMPVPSRNEGYDRRYYCVFSVILPPGSEGDRVVWTLRLGDESYSVPGHVQSPEYRIEEPDQPGRNSVSPLIRFLEPAGPEGRGRGTGLVAGPVTVRIGEALPIRIAVVEPGGDNPHAGFQNVLALWAKHQGPGNVTFGPGRQTPAPGGVETETTARFTEAGDYLLRVQAYEGSRPWGAQCCWSNGFLRVTVDP